MFTSANLLEDSGCPLSLVSRPPESSVLVLMGLPSTTTRGSCPPDIVPVPLIRKNAFVPASPLVFLTSKPETLPLSAETKLTSGESSTLSLLTDSMETPSFFVSCSTPRPVTTTVSRFITSVAKLKLKSFTSLIASL